MNGEIVCLLNLKSANSDSFKYKAMPLLKIPRITKEFVRDGFHSFDHYTLYDPDIVLNFHYPDTVLFTLLAHIKKPRQILDLGSFFGTLPFIVEEMSRVGGCPESFNWTLVDNCLYTKELAEVITTSSEISGKWLLPSHLDTWHNSVGGKSSRQRLYSQHNGWSVPPCNTEQFYDFWGKFATVYNVPKPSMTMHEDVKLLGENKFDLVHFDLTAGSYKLCVEMIHLLLEKHLQPDSIIVFDDMTPKHPIMLSFFQYLLRETNLRPVAFSTNKIAMMNQDYKDKFFQQAVEADLIDTTHAKMPYFSFMREGVPNCWGDQLNLRAN